VRQVIPPILQRCRRARRWADASAARGRRRSPPPPPRCHRRYAICSRAEAGAAHCRWRCRVRRYRTAEPMRKRENEWRVQRRVRKEARYAPLREAEALLRDDIRMNTKKYAQLLTAAFATTRPPTPRDTTTDIPSLFVPRAGVVWVWGIAAARKVASRGDQPPQRKNRRRRPPMRYALCESSRSLSRTCQLSLQRCAHGATIDTA